MDDPHRTEPLLAEMLSEVADLIDELVAAHLTADGGLDRQLAQIKAGWIKANGLPPQGT